MNNRPIYCKQCEENCKVAVCHAKDFKPMDNRQFNPTGGAYVPTASETTFALLIELSKGLIKLSDYDFAKSGKLRLKILIIDYAGKGPRKTFKGFGVYIADFGITTPKYCEFAIITNLAHFGSLFPQTGPHNCDPLGRRVYIFGSNRD